MPSKFFTNTGHNSFFAKFRSNLQSILYFHHFHAVISFGLSLEHLRLCDELIHFEKINNY